MKDEQKRLITIAEAATILGVRADTLRKWDRIGLLKPVRTLGGHRRYDAKAVSKLLRPKK